MTKEKKPEDKMTCVLCKKFIVPDMPGLSPRFFEVFEGEQFIVHEKCAEELQAQVSAIKNQKDLDIFLGKLLRKLSN